MNKKIYLAGGIHNNKNTHKWREEAKEIFGKRNCFDPTDKKYDRKTPKNLVMQDLELINNSDFVIVYFDKPSVGTSMEMFYAFVMGKTVLTITNKKTLSPWLVYHSTKIFKTLKDAKQYMEEL